MLNKELLFFSYEDVVPYTHIIIPKTSGWYIGFFGSNDDNSSMYPNSVHINGSDVKIRSLDTNYQNGFDKPYLHTAIRTIEYSPIQSLYLGSAETKQFSKFDGGNYDLGYVEYWNTSERDGVVFTLEDVGRPIRIWLSVDPPPRRVLGSRDTQTDLEYYVEEIPWEAQDAKQGPSVMQ